MKLTWKDLTWTKEKYKNLSLLTLPNQTEDYYRLAREYGDLFSKLIPKINKLEIFTVKPVIQFALFPGEIFLEKTQVPFPWATGCVRSINGKIADVLCYKYIPQRKILSFDKSNGESKRGNLHEILHLYFSQQINNSGSLKSVRSLNEGLCEFIPRIILNLQKEMEDSTSYLTSLKKKNLISFKDLDQYGMAHFSSEDVSKNVAYASSFLGVMWLAKKLSKEEDLLSGTKNLIQLLTKCSDRDQIYTTIEAKTGIDFLNSKLPMLESINKLKII
jgi:hypothetical protein